MKYASNNIRNILIAGHAGSGKTTLTEALVYFSGAMTEQPASISAAATDVETRVRRIIREAFI